MKLINCSFLTDENIHPDLVRFLVENGYDVRTAAQLNLAGKSDRVIIEEAYRVGRIIITHDSDFGTLAVSGGQPFTGIIYLRPGHIKGHYVIETLKTVLLQEIEITAGVIIVALRQNDTVKIRVRRQ